MSVRRHLDAAPLVALSQRYAASGDRGEAVELLAIGRDLYDWLSGPERWLETLLKELTPPFDLEVRGVAQPDEAAWAVLNAPWELLASAKGFLAHDEDLRYAPARRLGEPAVAAALDRYRLGIAFMAAAPRGARDLDFEAEEQAILQAASGDLDLFVEESGEAKELGRRLRDIGAAPPVLHLSSHGHDSWTGRDGRQAARPVLMLENDTGEESPTNASALVDALGRYVPRLLFLSACLTASARASATQQPALPDSLATGLIRAGVPAVLGWDGSVADVAATAFAQAFYEALGMELSVPTAAASARRALLRASEEAAGPGGEATAKDARAATGLDQQLRAEGRAAWRDWHLARLWLGPQGGGAIVGGGVKRSLLPANAGTKRLLTAKKGEDLVVADPAMFVGRRRELQRALRLLGSGDVAGVLLHGMGRLGKSSLAARISDRFSDRMRLAVVFGDYDALSVLAALGEALRGVPAARSILDRGRAAMRNDPAAFETVLIDLLSGPCEQMQGGLPVLLLIDDLERILEHDHSGRHHVRLEERPVLAALLRAFDPTLTESRLLVTSRFPFALYEEDEDLADRLAAIELSEFSTTAQRKLALRQLKAAQAKPETALSPAALEDRAPLLERAQRLARGNPGLQDLLGTGFALRRAVPTDRAAAVLEEMAAYLERGDMPATEQVREFLQNLALDALLDLAGDGGGALLRAATVFSLPVPECVIEALASAIGSRPEWLRDLGLLVPGDDPVIAGGVGWSVNGLAAGRSDPPSAAEKQAMAAVALPSLFDSWGGSEDLLVRPAAAGIELARLAIAAQDADVAAATATYAVRVLSGERPDEAAMLGQDAVVLLEGADREVPLALLARTAEAAATNGDGRLADALLAKGTARINESDVISTADLGTASTFLFRLGKRQMQSGDIDGALDSFRRLHAIELRRDNDHQAAVALGSIAAILQTRGELDAALRIRTEEELPVYTRLGDVRSVAVTQGQIADILQARGELDEARKLLTECLVVNRKLQDIDGIATSLWSLALLDVAQDAPADAFGRLQEAWPLLLRLRRPDGLAVVGQLYGQFLIAAERHAEAREVLRTSIAAFRTLGRDDDARDVEATLNAIPD